MHKRGGDLGKSNDNSVFFVGPLFYEKENLEHAVLTFPSMKDDFTFGVQIKIKTSLREGTNLMGFSFGLTIYCTSPNRKRNETPYTLAKQMKENQ